MNSQELYALTHPVRTFSRRRTPYGPPSGLRAYIDAEPVYLSRPSSYLQAKYVHNFDFQPTVADLNKAKFRVGGLLLPSGVVRVADPLTRFNPVSVPVAGDRADVFVGQQVSVAQVPETTVSTWHKVGACGVDSGMAGFWDASRQTAMDVLDTDDNKLLQVLIGASQAVKNLGVLGSVVSIPGGALALFTSIGGDGIYPVYVGQDATGRSVAVGVLFF